MLMTQLHDENSEALPVIPTSRPVSNPMFSCEALHRAIDALIATGSGEDLNAASVLVDILAQRGCEDMSADGVPHLTNLIDIIVYG